MTSLLERVFDALARRDPAHAAKIRRHFADADPAARSAAEAFFSRYERAMRSRGRTLDEGIGCYLELVEHMAQERMHFLRTGRYRHTSFAEVERDIYLNPAAFEYHMHGLVFAQFFWPDQLARFEFFRHHVGAALPHGGRYLEIGGGHALYLGEAIRQAPPGAHFTLVDISPSSLELARGMTTGLPVDFVQANIFDYAPSERFNFVALGEVIEHVEQPRALLQRVRDLLTPGGTLFVTTPANAPTIDHIYLFNSVEEIRAVLVESGFQIIHERVVYAESATPENARKLKLPVMFAAFVM